jgi:hypothetical protein
MRTVFVPPRTNEGSAFAGHVVLVWTKKGHTYALGFHDVSDIARRWSSTSLSPVESSS